MSDKPQDEPQTDATQTDTERLDWLAAHSTPYGSAIEMDHGVYLPDRGLDLRAAIDAAMARDGGA